MAVKTRNIKADADTEIAVWEEAAKQEAIDGKKSFNHWARHHLNKAAKRELRRKEGKQ